MTKFFADLELYFSYFKDILGMDEEQVLFTVNCLIGTAAEWFRPILMDYITYKEESDKMKK